jgi:two-component system OmpR family response regulator
MALRTMPIAKLQDLKSKIEAAINAKVSERRRELETELAKLAQFGGRGGKAIRSETVLRVGDLRMDLVSRTVTRCGRDIELLPREFQVLEYLVSNQGQVVPRAMLLQHVWDLHFDPTNNIIDVYVGRVRRKVDDQQAYPLIHTIRGVGFCVRAPCYTNSRTD